MQLPITAESGEKLLKDRNCYESSDNLYLCKVLKTSFISFINLPNIDPLVIQISCKIWM